MSLVTSSMYRKGLLRPRSKGDYHSVHSYPDPVWFSSLIFPLGRYYARKKKKKGWKCGKEQSWDSFLYLYPITNIEFYLIYLLSSQICNLFPDLTSGVDVHWQQLNFLKTVKTGAYFAYVCSLCVLLSPFECSKWISQEDRKMQLNPAFFGPIIHYLCVSLLS